AAFAARAPSPLRSAGGKRTEASRHLQALDAIIARTTAYVRRSRSGVIPEHWSGSASRLPVGHIGERVLVDLWEYADVGEAGLLQQWHELVLVPEAHRESVLFAAPVTCLCADRHEDAMVVLFDRIDPGAQRDLAAGRLIPLPHLPS